MSKIRILAIPSDNHGTGKFRILLPYTKLQENHGEDFHVDIKMDVPDDDGEFDGYDVVVYHTSIHRGSSFEKTIERVKWLQSKGIVVVLDCDDYWELDIRHPMYHVNRAKTIAQNKMLSIRTADYLTVTTPIFRKTLEKKLGKKNVYVLPNAVDPNEDQFKPNPTPSNRIRFGWLGGSSHLHDIELMSIGISRLMNERQDNCQFVLCGFDLRGNMTEINKQTGEKRVRPIKPEESVWHLYEKIFTDNYKTVSGEYLNFLRQHKHLPYNDGDQLYVRKWTEPINSYALNYNHFDVSLAPLVQSVFNSNKSQLKAIESGFHKKALIASDVEPYTVDLVSAIDKGGKINPKGNSLLVSPTKNHKQWYQHMKRLIDNPTLIEDLGGKLYETIYPKYNIDVVTAKRAENFKTIINKQKQ